MNKTNKNNPLLSELIDKSEGSYSYDRYSNWNTVCQFMLSCDFTVEEAATILNSKWTRWAGDMSDKKYGQITAKDLERFLDKQTSANFQSLFSEVGLTYRGNYKNIASEIK